MLRRAQDTASVHTGASRIKLYHQLYIPPSSLLRYLLPASRAIFVGVSNTVQTRLIRHRLPCVRQNRSWMTLATLPLAHLTRSAGRGLAFLSREQCWRPPRLSWCMSTFVYDFFLGHRHLFSRPTIRLSRLLPRVSRVYASTDFGHVLAPWTGGALFAPRVYLGASLR